jgi:hypothetical protein
VCQDGLNLILDFTVDDFRLRGWQGAAAKGFRRRNKGLKPVNVKNIMNAHSGWKLNLEGDRGALLEKSEGAKEPSLKGGGRTGGVIGSGDVFRVK